MKIFDLRTITYADGVALQEQAVQKVLEGNGSYLFLLEHYPVISFGRNGGEENLPFSEEFFKERGIDLEKSARGGNITCHFPGQLVAYPIMRFEKKLGGLRRFFYNLEESVITTLAVFGVNAHRVDGRPGVWLGSKKICSIGTAMKHWVTSHGLALNIKEDLSLFNIVTPCGLPGVTATSLHREMGSDTVTMDEVKTVFAKQFIKVFELHEKAEIMPFQQPITL